MADGGGGGGAIALDLNQQIQAAIANILASADPNPENRLAGPGTGNQASRWDHVHPRLTSVTSGVLAANGEDTVTFTRTFAQKPGHIIEYEELADNPPVMFKVKSWIQDGQGNYTGCVIKGYRGQVLPANILSLTVLVSFNVYAGTASGVAYSFVAIQKS